MGGSIDQLLRFFHSGVFPSKWDLTCGHDTESRKLHKRVVKVFTPEWQTLYGLFVKS